MCQLLVNLLHILCVGFISLVVSTSGKQQIEINDEGGVSYHNWCKQERCGKVEATTSNASETHCHQKVLIFLLSEQSKAFALLSDRIKEDPLVSLLPADSSHGIIEACANMSSSVTTFNSFTGDPFTHNPFNIEDIFYNIQQICLKNLNNMEQSTTAAMATIPALDTTARDQKAVRKAHNIIAFSYRFPTFTHVKHLLSIFPCARVVVSKKYANTKKLRSLRRAVQEVSMISPQHPEPEEVEMVLKWLGHS
jgi:hypothetical protein